MTVNSPTKTYHIVSHLLHCLRLCRSKWFCLCLRLYVPQDFPYLRQFARQDFPCLRHFARQEFPAFGITPRRSYLPSALCTEGLLCLRLFARRDFSCLRHFCTTGLSLGCLQLFSMGRSCHRHFVRQDFPAFGFTHRRSSLPSALCTEGLFCLRLFARQNFSFRLGHF